MRNWLAVATMAAGLLGGSFATAADVWIGGSRAWGDYTTPGNESKWTFLQKNVSGLYINNFAMRPKEAKQPTRQERLDGMYKLLKNKKVFYETDLVHSEDDFDQNSIDLFKETGFGYVGATINRGTSDARNKIITHDGTLPLYYMFGPWNGDGHIKKPKNDALRKNILKYAGAAVDDPVTMWRGPTGSRNTRQMVYSTIKWCHKNKKKFLFLLAPNDSGPSFLPEAKSLVHDLEDNKAFPDIFAVAFYGPQSFREKLEVLPEADDDGKPMPTFSGVPYWLIHHLKDPKKWAALSALGGENIALRKDESKEFVIDLKNRSDWLDLTPVIRLRSQKAAGYAIRATLDGHDITSDLLGDGVILSGNDRLNPGTNRRFVVQVTRDSTSASTAAWALELLPNPSDMSLVNQTLQLTANAPAPLAPVR